MDDDRLTLAMFAGVFDLLQKQEIGLSSARGDTCKDGYHAACVVHGSQPSAG